MNLTTNPRIGATALCMLAIALSCGRAQAVGELPLYHAELLGDRIEAVFPGVEFPSSDARGLNENGDLIGEAKLDWDPVEGAKMQAFIYTAEHGVVKLPLIDGYYSNAVRDISDRDENGEVIIVGGGVPGLYVDIVIGTAALWRYSTVTGEVLETRVIGIPAGYEDSLAVAVTNDGTVAGFSGLTGPFTNWKYDIATDLLETFDFPTRITDMNNLGQVCGGAYRGDLFGNYEDLTETYEPGDVMPYWAVDNGGISAFWHRINDHGSLVGRAGTGIWDGAGHMLVAIVRRDDEVGWVGFDPISHLSLAGGINNLDDFMVRQGGVYLEDQGDTFSFESLLAPEWQPLVNVSWSQEMNDHRQVAGSQAHAFLLTPLGTMIIPGDVNGDVSVDLADHCAWVAAPIDLNGDGVVDEQDEQWLIERLAVFGHTVTDCNGNGIGDYCEIADGTAQDCDGNGLPDECQPDCNGDGVPDACESDCNANGIPDPCDIADGTSQDCNENGIPDECDGGGLIEASVVHDPPRFMYQDDVIVEHVLVTEAGIVDDVNLTLSYRYRIGYTKVELSHNGTTVTILDRPGHPAHLNGFVNFGYVAIVDDEGEGPYLENIGDECCSFETILSPPSYRPNAPLTPRLDAFDGMPTEGTWTFTMTTTDDFSSGDGLHGWGLEITRAGAEVPPCCAGDIDNSTDVGFGDLLAVLSNWGACPDGCPADLDGDGEVSFGDLLMVLSNWGPCP